MSQRSIILSSSVAVVGPRIPLFSQLATEMKIRISSSTGWLSNEFGEDRIIAIARQLREEIYGQAKLILIYRISIGRPQVTGHELTNSHCLLGWVSNGRAATLQERLLMAPSSDSRKYRRDKRFSINFRQLCANSGPSVHHRPDNSFGCHINPNLMIVRSQITTWTVCPRKSLKMFRMVDSVRDVFI